jgi:hypothetical protein
MARHTRAPPAASLFLLILLSPLTPLVLAFQSTSSSIYLSPDRSFQLSVPPGYSVQTGNRKSSNSYIPICHDDSLVCITFPPGHYTGTTFEGASVEVTLLPPKTSQACMNPGTFELSTHPDAAFQIDAKSPTRVIDGAPYWHASVGAGASSHQVVGDVYRGYRNGRCYELALRVTFTNFAAYPPGAIKEFTSQDQKRLAEQLRRILDSFRSLR